MIGWFLLLVAAAGIELGTWILTGRTLSQHLWNLQARKPWTRYVILAGLIILTTHLVWGWP